MGLDKHITITCDYAGCKLDKGCPAVVHWSETQVNQGKIKAPEEAQYLVIFNQNGEVRTFCGQLHAALYFLPKGYEVVEKKVVEIQKKPGWKSAEPEPLTSEGATSQADGYAEESPVNGQICGCGHPWDFHNEHGCLMVLSNKPGDFCRCEKPGPKVPA